MPSIANGKRRSNAPKSAAAVPRSIQPAFQVHSDSSAQPSPFARSSSSTMRSIQPAFQVHRDSSAQPSPLARASSSTMALKERDVNTNVAPRRKRGRPSRGSALSMPPAKQRKTAQQMESSRQNHEDRSGIRKLRDRWEETRQRHQRYCERATRLNRTPPSSLPVTPEELRLTPIQSLVSCPYDTCIDCGVPRALSDFPFRNLIDSLALCVYCIDKSDIPKTEMRWCMGDKHNALR